MKLSEIIEILQENIDKHGDLHCLSDDEGGSYMVRRIRVLYTPSNELFYPRGEPMVDKEDMEEIGDAAFFLDI